MDRPDIDRYVQEFPPSPFRSMIATFYKIKFFSFKNKISHLSFAGEIKFSLGIIIGALFLWALYIGFYRVLLYIQNLEMIGSIVLLKFLRIAFFTTFAMVVFSSIITSFSTIYFSEDLNFLITCPVNYVKVFLVKTVETAIQSSWMMLVTLIPFLVAFANVKSANIWFLFGFVVLAVPFFFISAVIGIFISSLIMSLFPSSRTRDVVLILAILIGSMAYVAFRFIEPEKLANPDTFIDAMEYIAYLNAPTFKFLPSNWFSEVLNSLLTGKISAIVLNSAYLFGCACLLFVLIAFLSRYFYYNSWVEVQTTSSSSKNKGYSIKFNKLIFFNSRLHGLLSKDIRNFIRNAQQWSQLLLVMALVIVYLFSLYKLPAKFGPQITVSFVRNFIAFLNMGAIGFILAALALRFVFPQISLEKNTLWILFSSPLSVKEIFVEKFLISCPIIILLGILLGVASNLLLGVSTLVFWFYLMNIIILSIGIGIMALGMGIMYPKFDAENIPQVEMSSGGIFYTICAIFYIGLTLAILARPAQILIRHELGAAIDWSHLMFNGIELFLVNLIAIFLPVWYGMKSLKNQEV